MEASNNKRVWLVEDDPVQVFLIEKYLRSLGMCESVTVYRNGKEAYQSLKDELDQGHSLPDLVLLDLNMPIWGGWDFMDALLQIAPEGKHKVYILSSSMSADDTQQAEEFGLGNQYLSKPVRLEQLRLILESV